MLFQLPVDDKKPGNGAPLVGILKNGSIKRNGDLALPQLDSRIVEEDEEESEDKETSQQKEEKAQIEMNEKTKTNEKAEDNKESLRGEEGSPEETSNESTKNLENNQQPTKLNEEGK